jgi:hypothetical protein
MAPNCTLKANLKRPISQATKSEATKSQATKSEVRP